MSKVREARRAGVKKNDRSHYPEKVGHREMLVVPFGSGVGKAGQSS